MSETLDLSDPDFTAQMEGLVEQATQALGERVAAVRKVDAEKSSERESEERALKAYQSLPQMLKPFVQGIEALTRVAAENSQVLGRVDAATADVLEPLKKLPAIVAELQGVIERKDALSRQMFDALHEELRGYRDGFFLESIHRPIIRDLITLYDDWSDSHEQMTKAVEDLGGVEDPDLIARFKVIDSRAGHNLAFLLEVLARYDVIQLPVGTGKLDKQTQRAIAVEVAESEGADYDVVKVVRRGFLWKNRVIRPEEVIIKRWKEGLAAEPETDK